MAWHLVSLKFALLRNGVRRAGRGAAIGLTIALLVAVSLGGTIGLALLGLRNVSSSGAADSAAGVFAALLALWVLGPVLMLASDGTLDVDRLALFPLSARHLMPGLLAAAPIGAGGLFTFLVLLGAFAGVATHGVVALYALIAVALEFALMLATSRLVSTALSAATGKRRWRDLALFLGPVLALVFNFTIQIANRRFLTPSRSGRPRRQPHSLLVLRAVLRWLPTGWPTQSIYAARAGQYVVGLVGLAATAVLIVAVMWLWWRAIQMVTTNSNEGGIRGRTAPSALIPRITPWLPRTAVGGIAAKELRYVWREPRRRAAVFAAGFASLLPLVAFGNVTHLGPRSALLVAWPAYNLSSYTNVFGFDSDRLWVDVAAGIRLETELVARALSRLVIVVPVLAVMLTALAFINGSPTGIVSAIGLAAAVLGTGFGYGAAASVRAPFPMPDEKRSNVFGGGTGGQNAGAGAAALATLVLAAATVSPILIAALVIPASSPRQLFVAAAGIAEGVAVWIVALRVATRNAHTAEAELLARLTRS